MEFNFNSYGNSKQSISYCEVDKCKTVIKLKKCLADIKEIAEAITNGTHFSDDIETHLKEMVNKILKKINEVEDDK